MGFWLAKHRDETIRRIPVDSEAAERLEEKFENLATDYLADRELIPYAPAYKPSEDELLAVDYELPSGLARIRDAMPSGLEALTQKHLSLDPPVALVWVKVAPKKSPSFVFQGFSTRNVLRPGRAMFFGNGDFKFNDRAGLVPGEKIDALHEGGQLVFRNELVVRRFLDMEEFFTEASNEVVEEFFGSSQFKVPDLEKVKVIATKLQRRQIAALNKASDFDMKAVRRVAREANLSVIFEGETLVIPPDRRRLTCALDLLSDSYVHGAITKNLYLSNSKRLVVTAGGAS